MFITIITPLFKINFTFLKLNLHIDVSTIIPSFKITLTMKKNF